MPALRAAAIPALAEPSLASARRNRSANKLLLSSSVAFSTSSAGAELTDACATVASLASCAQLSTSSNAAASGRAPSGSRRFAGDLGEAKDHQESICAMWKEARAAAAR